MVYWKSQSFVTVSKTLRMAPVLVALGIAAPPRTVAQAPRLALKEYRAGTVVSVAISKDGRMVIAANAGTGFVHDPGGDRTLFAWDARTGAQHARFESDCDVWDLAFLPDGGHFLAAQEDGDVVLRETRTGRIARRFRGHVGRVGAIDVAKDGATFVSCGIDGVVRLWDVQTGDQRHAFIDASPTLLVCVRMVRGDRTAVAGGLDGALRVYDLAGLVGPRRLPERHSDQVNAVAGLPGGRVLSAGRDGSLRLWDIDNERQLARWEAGTDVTALTVSPGGRRVLFGGTDRLLHLRDVGAGRDRTVLGGHEDWIWDLRFSADGKTAVSAGRDGSVRVWEVAPGDVDPAGNGAGGRRPARGRRGPF